MSMNREVLVGSDAKVIGSSNPSDIGIKGMIVDETAHMLDIEDENGTIRRIIKKNVILEIDGVHVDGMTILGRSENRIKNRIKLKRR